MTNKIINRIVQIKNIILNSTSFTEKNYYLKIKYLTIKIMIIKYLHEIMMIKNKKNNIELINNKTKWLNYRIF